MATLEHYHRIDAGPVRRPIEAEDAAHLLRILAGADADQAADITVGRAGRLYVHVRRRPRARGRRRRATVHPDSPGPDRVMAGDTGAHVAPISVLWTAYKDAQAVEDLAWALPANQEELGRTGTPCRVATLAGLATTKAFGKYVEAARLVPRDGHA